MCVSEYVLQWVPVGTHDWHKFLSPTTLSSLIEHAYHPSQTPFVDYNKQAQPHTPTIPKRETHAETDTDEARAAAKGKLGMHVTNVCGMTFDPFFSRWSLNRNDTDCNYILTAVRAHTPEQTPTHTS